MSESVSSTSGARKLSSPLSIEKKQLPEVYDKKIRKVAQLYETQFLQQMFKAMKGTVHKSGFIKEGLAEKTFQQKLDQKYVDEWGSQGGVGLAKIIYNQIKEKILEAQGNNFVSPRGPIDLQEGATLKIEGDRIQPLGEGAEKGARVPEVSFLIDNLKEEPFSKGAPVRSPWSGVVENVVSGEGERKALQIRHVGSDLLSVLSYRGVLQGVSRGSVLTAGQQVGRLDPSVGSLSWTVKRG